MSFEGVTSAAQLGDWALKYAFDQAALDSWNAALDEFEEQCVGFGAEDIGCDLCQGSLTLEGGLEASGYIIDIKVGDELHFVIFLEEDPKTSKYTKASFNDARNLDIREVGQWLKN